MASSALELFPDEVWEMIFEKLEDSKHILKTVGVFPELEGILKRNAHLWLFDQVVGQLFLCLSHEEFKGCRQVCKRWSRGVDSFLENHPSLRAHQTGDPIKRFWDPEVHQVFCEPYHAVRKKYPRVTFSTPEQIAKFLDDMGDRAEERNPFVGRSVKLIVHSDRYLSTSFWEVVKGLLRKFGTHIWFIEVSIRTRQTAINFFRKLLHIISPLPNLKSLKISEGTGYSINDLSQDFRDGTYWFKDPFARKMTNFWKSPKTAIPTSHYYRGFNNCFIDQACLSRIIGKIMIIPI